MIIFINGSINSGKSTVAKLLMNKLPCTANVEIDRLREFINWLEIDKAVPINIENAISVIHNFVKHGFHVIVPYPLSHKNYELFKSSLNNHDLYFITLAPDIKKAQTSTSDRILTDWEIDRISYLYKIGIPNPSFGKIINNTNQTPDETVSEIMKYIGDIE